MNREDLTRIKDYCEKATAGPWVLKDDDARRNIGIEMVKEVVAEYNPTRALVTLHATAWKPERWGNAKPNAEFIVNARTDLPLLVEEVLKLREINVRLQDEIVHAYTQTL